MSSTKSRSDTISNEGEDFQYEQEEDIDEVQPRRRNSNIGLIIALVALLVSVFFLVYNIFVVSATPPLKRNIKYSPIESPIVVSPNDVPTGELKSSIPYNPDIFWVTVPPKELLKTGHTSLELVPVLDTTKFQNDGDASFESVIRDSIAAAFAKNIPSSDRLNTTSFVGDISASGDQGGVQKTINEQIADYINSRIPTLPKELSKTKCASPDIPGDENNWIFITATAMPTAKGGKLSTSATGGGYCVRTCESSRRDPENKEIFDTRKIAGTNEYVINYELQYSVDLAKSGEGFQWYCFAVPNVKVDGLGWVKAQDGIYARRQVSPIFYETTVDQYIIDTAGGMADATPQQRSDNQTDINLCASNALPVPAEIRAKGYRFDDKGNDDKNKRNGNPSGRWWGRIYGRDGNHTSPYHIGRGKTEYHLSDFQMLGKYCYWVGHDQYRGSPNSSEADKNFHGDFTKVDLQNACPKQVVSPDGLKYDMSLTPSKKSCYYCPNVYEWDIDGQKLVAYETFLRGSEEDGYVCVRKCPNGTSDHLTSSLHWCLTKGVSTEIKPPNTIISS